MTKIMPDAREGVVVDKPAEALDDVVDIEDVMIDHAFDCSA